MDVSGFGAGSSGELVPISGTDPRFGAWEHYAFVPDPLPEDMPGLSPATYLRIGNARAALASLDSTATQLENPRSLRQPTLRREAQSTSALEGTYAPLSDVLVADEHDPGSVNLREILNFVFMAEYAYSSVMDGRSLSVSFLCELQEMLVRNTAHEASETGQLRSIQVVVGQRPDAPPDTAPVFASRFVPPPPGDDLRARLSDLLEWMNRGHTGRLDPVVASGMGHYQFETLHPFHDGNGRIGRFLMSVQLLKAGAITEPILTVSPWFEARRGEYYDRLLAVSTDSDWDGWLGFYATGLEESAIATRAQVLRLVAAQKDMHEVIRGSSLRAGTAFDLADYAVANPSFTVRDVERDLRVSYGRANKLVEQLVELDVLDSVAGRRARRFFAPAVRQVIVTS